MISRKLALAALVLLVASNALGYKIGDLNSPLYDEGTAVFYIASNAEIDESETEGHKLRVAAGPYLYTYNQSRSEVVKNKLPISSIERRKRRFLIDEMISLYDTYDMTTAVAAAAGIVKSAHALSRTNKAPPPLLDRMMRKRDKIMGAMPLATIAVLAPTVGVIGYAIGYSDSRRYESPEFIEGMESISTWEYVTMNLAICDALADAPVSYSGLSSYLGSIEARATRRENTLVAKALKEIRAELELKEANRLLSCVDLADCKYEGDFSDFKKQFGPACAEVEQFWQRSHYPGIFGRVDRLIPEIFDRLDRFFWDQLGL